MKRLQKLKTLTRYLETFRMEDWPGIIPKSVVDNENATGQLSKAAGDQVLIALPELQQSGESTDSFSSSLSTAFFVLAKINGPARTPELASETYSRLASICESILERLEQDMDGDGIAAPCPLLSGLSLFYVSIIPVYSVFGGWSGYSIEMTFS